MKFILTEIAMKKFILKDLFKKLNITPKERYSEFEYLPH